MKKVLVLTVFMIASIFAGESLFTGTWCIEDQELSISFADDGVVTYSSESEDGMSGEGTFVDIQDTLTANIANEDMEITIRYTYKQNEIGLLVKTEFISINGDAIEHSEEWIQLQRCGK